MYTLEESRRDWYPFSGRTTVQGDLHSVAIVVENLGTNGKGVAFESATFSLDWLSVRPLTPNGQDFLKWCDKPVEVGKVEVY